MLGNGNHNVHASADLHLVMPTKSSKRPHAQSEKDKMAKKKNFSKADVLVTHTHENKTSFISISTTVTAPEKSKI